MPLELYGNLNVAPRPENPPVKNRVDRIGYILTILFVSVSVSVAPPTAPSHRAKTTRSSGDGAEPTYVSFQKSSRQLSIRSVVLLAIRAWSIFSRIPSSAPRSLS